MTRFEKISKEQFATDCGDQINYEDVVLPKRATKGSAGYDFFSLTSFTLKPGAHIKIPTGIRVLLPSDKFLMIVPRSSLGFKFRLQLDNTVGIIDSDYSHSDNEGHIWMKITNDTVDGKTLHINAGDAIAQGIILPFCKTDDDEVENERNGGLGSTNSFNQKTAFKDVNKKDEQVIEMEANKLSSFDITATGANTKQKENNS